MGSAAGAVLQYTTELITGFFPLVNISAVITAGIFKRVETDSGLAWDKVLKSFSFFVVKGKLVTKSYMSQNKLQFFLKLKECAQFIVHG